LEDGICNPSTGPRPADIVYWRGEAPETSNPAKEKTMKKLLLLLVTLALLAGGCSEVFPWSM